MILTIILFLLAGLFGTGAAENRWLMALALGCAALALFRLA